MCIDTVSLPNVSRYGDISIYCCNSNASYKTSHKFSVATVKHQKTTVS